MTAIRNRGTQDILIAVVDGLKGFPEAITAVFPQTLVQTCIVHLIRYSMQFASWKERRAIVGALKPIYRAESAEAARQRLEEFDAGPGGRSIRPSPRAGGGIGSRSFHFSHSPPKYAKLSIRPMPSRAYTSQVRKAVRGRGHFPSDEAATKLIWLVLRNMTIKWKNPPISWHAAKTQLALQFEDRFVMSPT